MRIACKIKALAIMLGVLAFSGGAALAADAPLPASNATAVTASPPPALVPLPPMPSAPKTAANTLENLENKVPDSVKEVMKHLDKTTEDVTLDDLNSARQAVAKIEALIELEKHLVELDKIRQEREKKISFAGAIPASALQPPPSLSSISLPANAPPPVMAERPLEVSRIMGRNGRYSAVVKMSDDKTRTVQVGDHLPNGDTVLGITATEVELGRGSNHQSLHIKNVDTVFGNAL